jgi:hypothetical protein
MLFVRTLDMVASHCIGADDCLVREYQGASIAQSSRTQSYYPLSRKTFEAACLGTLHQFMAESFTLQLMRTVEAAVELRVNLSVADGPSVASLRSPLGGWTVTPFLASDSTSYLLVAPCSKIRWIYFKPRGKFRSKGAILACDRPAGFRQKHKGAELHSSSRWLRKAQEPEPIFRDNLQPQ